MPQEVEVWQHWFLFVGCGLLSHPIFKQLPHCVDLTHSCGYISMLSTGDPCGSVQSPDTQPLISLDDMSHDQLATSSMDVTAFTPRDDPGISECPLDTNSVTDSNESSRWKQDHPDGWVPLELYFGIPLFDMAVNKQVSEKVRND